MGISERGAEQDNPGNSAMMLYRTKKCSLTINSFERYKMFECVLSIFSVFGRCLLTFEPGKMQHNYCIFVYLVNISSNALQFEHKIYRKINIYSCDNFRAIWSLTFSVMNFFISRV